MTPVRLPYPIPSFGFGASASRGRDVRAELIGHDHRDRREPTGAAGLSSTPGCRVVPATFPLPSRWGPSPRRAGAIHPGGKSPGPAGRSGWLDGAPRSRRFPGGEPARVCPGDGARRDEAGGTVAGRGARSEARAGSGRSSGGGTCFARFRSLVGPSWSTSLLVEATTCKPPPPIGGERDQCEPD